MRVAIYTPRLQGQPIRDAGHGAGASAAWPHAGGLESPADAYIINTCSVTAVSDKKSRQMIRRAKSRNPQAVVAACGCYVQTHTPEAQELGIDLIGGTGDRMVEVSDPAGAGGGGSPQPCGGG